MFEGERIKGMVNPDIRLHDVKGSYEVTQRMFEARGLTFHFYKTDDNPHIPYYRTDEFYGITWHKSWILFDYKDKEKVECPHCKGMNYV